MKLKKKHIHIFSTFLGICIVSFVILLVWPISKSVDQQVNEYYRKYSSEKAPVTRSILKNLTEIINNIGAEGAMKLVLLVESKNQLNRRDCHVIMHLVGHSAYSSKLKTIPSLLQKYGNFCQSGFTHGVEAQITLEETDVKLRNKKLNELCSLYKSFFPQSSSCFHGVGHAYYQQMRDPGRALKACDTLNGQVPDFKSCYQGVFSEFANDIIGYDGETGLPVPGIHKKIDNPDRPLSYCDSYDLKYRDTCYFTMTIVSLGKREGSEDFTPCVYPEYKEEAKELCVEYIAAITSREKMEYTNSYIVPQAVMKMNEPLQKSYIKGVSGVVNAYARDGQNKDWGSICNSMSPEISGFCKDYIHNNLFDYRQVKFIQE